MRNEEFLHMTNSYSAEEVEEYIKARQNANSKMIHLNKWREYKISYSGKEETIIWNPYYEIGLSDRSLIDEDKGNLHYHMIYPIIRFGYNKEHPEMSCYSQIAEFRQTSPCPKYVMCLYPFDECEKTEGEPDLPTNKDVIDLFKKLAEISLNPELGPIHAQKIRVALWTLMCTIFKSYAKYSDSAW